MSPTIRCEALVKRFGDHVAVAGVDLEVLRGQCLGLLGPNGAGKTTTVEILEGLSSPTSGRIELFGLSWGTGHDREIRQRFGVQLQETVLADKLKVAEVLRLFRSFCDRGRPIEEVLEAVDLTEQRERPYHALSGGQKQRVALACAIVGDPELLFLDEPTTGLDPRARESLWAVIEGFREAGGTILLTTHYMEEAATLCDRIAIMDRGRLIAEGSPADLVDSLGSVQFVEFESDGVVDLPRLSALDAVVSATRRDRRVRLSAQRGLDSLGAVLAELVRQGIAPVGLSTHQATLHDVFLQMTGRELATSDPALDEPASREVAR